MLTAMVLQATEETIAQYLNYRQGLVEMKPSRVVRYGFYGLCIGGPLGHFLNTALDRAFAQATFPLAQIVRVLVSSFAVMPITIGAFLVFNAMADNMNYNEARAYLGRTYLNVLKLAWRVFPLAQIVVYKTLPNKMWLPTLMLVGFLFGIYMKFMRIKMASRTAKAKQAPISKPASH